MGEVTCHASSFTTALFTLPTASSFPTSLQTPDVADLDVAALAAKFAATLVRHNGHA